jgi:hypothetical protein
MKKKKSWRRRRAENKDEKSKKKLEAWTQWLKSIIWKTMMGRMVFQRVRD